VTDNRLDCINFVVAHWPGTSRHYFYTSKTQPKTQARHSVVSGRGSECA